MKPSLIKLFLLVMLASFLSACSPSQTIPDLQITQSSESPVIPTPSPPPTQILAIFLNPPAYLEEKFSSRGGWAWMESPMIEGRRWAFRQQSSYQNTLTLVHEKDMISIGETGSFSDTFTNFVLDLFVPISTREKIIQFRNNHVEPGNYQSIIDGFIVEISIIEGTDNYIIEVTESP